MKENSKNSSNNSVEPTAILNNDETTDNRFIQNNNNNKHSIIVDHNDSYNNISLEETFILRYSDPVNSISLTDNYLIFGSMIGKVLLYNIEKKHFYQLYDLANENIMGSSLENKINDKTIHYIAIGDESVVSIFEKDNEKDIEANTIYNYEEKDTHNLNCPDNFTLLWKNKALIINLYAPKEYNEDFDTKNNSFILITYEIEDKRKDLIVEGSIEMSNYSVPFDFKDNIFLFLEHHPKDKRSIGIYEFKEIKNSQNIENGENGENEDNSKNNKGKKRDLITVDKNFGHISFMKILNKNLILMVRNYNKIELYDIENKFKLISTYNSNYEINAIDFYEIKNNENEDEENDENDNNIINEKLKLKQYNIIFIDVEQNIFELKFKNELNSQMKVLFKKNVKNINGISGDLKNKGLFDLDFPYYIKNSPNFIALTTDQACFLFRKDK